MTLKQYLRHLWEWLCSFPRWSEMEHTTAGIAGSGHYECLICDYVENDPEEAK